MHAPSDMPLKIAYDLRFAHRPGGGSVYTSQLLQFMAQNYSDTQWCLIYNPDSQPQQNIIKNLQNLPHNPVIDLLPVRSPILSLRQHLEFFRRRLDADLYHYTHFDAPIGLRQAPLVLTILDLYPLTLPDYCSPAKRLYFKHLTKYNARRAAMITTISHYSKKDIVEHLNIPEQKIVVTPLGFTSDFHPIDNQLHLDLIQKKYQLPPEFIFYCGNHKPHKNLTRLITAYARLPESLKQNFPLVLTGKPEGPSLYLSQLTGQLKITQNVSFTGWIDQQDLPPLYNLASLFVLPSLYEGFGLPPLEAMACGTPVACANATAIPEVVGSVGRLFDPCNTDDITSTLQTALEQDINNPQTKQACRERAAQFSWEKTAQITHQLYQTTTQNHNST